MPLPTILIALAVLPLQAGGVAEEPAPPPPPDVLLIAVDDLNCDLSCYGHPLARTPSIDRLASRGVRFERAYCQYPLCNPSRTSLLTGLRPERTGVLKLRQDYRAVLPDVVTLPQLFRQNGWHTARVGKVGHGQERADPLSWDEELPVHGDDQELSGELVNLTPMFDVHTGLAWCASTLEEERFFDARVAREAIRLLEQPREAPLFLAVGFLRPHLPFVAPPSYFDAVPLERIPAPEVAEGELDAVPTLSLSSNEPHWGLPADDLRAAIRGYHAATGFVDAQIGKLLDALDRLGLAERTVVVLFSDHGFLLGQHGQWMKWSLFEPGVRVPLLIAGPGIRPGVCARTVELLDLFPTLADLAGLEPPPGLEGASLRPLLEDPARTWGRPALAQLERNGFTGWSLRTERWRYTEWLDGRLGRELYDHDADPGELHNRAEEPELAATIEELRALLRRTRAGG